MSIHQQSDDKFLDNLETEFVFDIKKYGPHSYPRWLEIEKEKRAIIAEPEYYISGISLTFLKPDGKEHTYKYYPFRKKKMANGGVTRADGIAQRGKTRGKMC